MSKLIAITGFKGSGKDTAAQYFVQQGFKHESYASPLKDSLAAIFNWDRQLLEGTTPQSRAWREQPDEWWSKKLNQPGVTPRQILQQLGTNVFRDRFHDNIWIDSLEARIKDSDQNIVISDCRFKNEIASVHGLGGKVIWIQRGPLPDWYNCAINELTLLETKGYEAGWESEMANNYPSVHKSEWSWLNSNFDAIISNNSTKQDLNSILDQFSSNNL